MPGPEINPGHLPPECEALRIEVRAFLAEAMVDIPVTKRCRNWSGADPAFSREMGKRGWIGMTWPQRYGDRNVGHRLGQKRPNFSAQRLAFGWQVAGVNFWAGHGVGSSRQRLVWRRFCGRSRQPTIRASAQPA